MNETWSAWVGDATDAMNRSDPCRAAAAVGRLEGLARGERLHADGAMSAVWESFTRLLHRRGYYVSTPSELTASLDEVRGVGAGFDLYDLARAMADYDVAVTECLGLTPRRHFPVLIPFTPACDCNAHSRNEGRKQP